MSLKAQTRRVGHTGRLQGKRAQGIALNGDLVPEAGRKRRDSTSQTSVCAPLLIFLYREIRVQHPEQERAAQGL